MRWLLAGALAILLVVAQTTLLGASGPDLALFFTLACAYLGEPPAGSLAGLWAGMLMGAAWGNLESAMAAVYTLVGWTSELAFTRWGRSIPVVALVTALAAGLGIALQWALFLALDLPPQQALQGWWERILWSEGLMLLLRGRG